MSAFFRRWCLKFGHPTRHTFGGLTDAAFRMIGPIEAGRHAAWPWTADPD
ncbi:hypothetical protein ACTVZO_42785 [Streptomyces sp. IBSNAI002]